MAAEVGPDDLQNRNGASILQNRRDSDRVPLIPANRLGVRPGADPPQDDPPDDDPPDVPEDLEQNDDPRQVLVDPLPGRPPGNPALQVPGPNVAVRQDSCTCKAFNGIGFVIVLVLLASLLIYDVMKEERDKKLLAYTLTSCSRVVEKHPEKQGGGVFTIYPIALQKESLKVYCDTTDDGGGWMVIQRRVDRSVNFNRNWTDYVSGFGDVERNYWIGLEKLHKLTSTNNYQLLVNLKANNGINGSALYLKFEIGAAETNYTLSVSGFTERDTIMGDSLSYHDGKPFSAPDYGTFQSCAIQYSAGWWYFGDDCYECNLNGPYDDKGGMAWKSFATQSALAFDEMKIRIVN